MANTYTYNHPGGAGTAGVTSGYVVCDGSTDVYVNCGFIPSTVVVEIVNDPSGTPADGARWVWHNDGNSITIVTAVDNSARSVDAGLIASYDTDIDEELDGTAAGRGFMVPNADVAADDVLYWRAYR